MKVAQSWRTQMSTKPATDISDEVTRAGETGTGLMEQIQFGLFTCPSPCIVVSGWDDFGLGAITL
jgi:hypothetical protein